MMDIEAFWRSIARCLRGFIDRRTDAVALNPKKRRDRVAARAPRNDYSVDPSMLCRAVCTEKRHSHVEWLRFLKQIDHETPTGTSEPSPMFRP
jgi:hypothetical protein